MKGWLVSI